MRIVIQIENTTTGRIEREASAYDIDSAIAELGSIQRHMQRGAKCLYCGEYWDDGSFCTEYCAEQDSLNNKDEVLSTQ